MTVMRDVGRHTMSMIDDGKVTLSMAVDM